MDDEKLDPAAGAESLAAVLDGYGRDPLGFVIDTFPWGRGPLTGHHGPRAWQAAFLTDLGHALAEGRSPIQLATASGHGIGKSALVAWLTLWAMATREMTRAVLTANTEAQLRGKTGGELARWHQLWSLSKPVSHDRRRAGGPHWPRAPGGRIWCPGRRRGRRDLPVCTMPVAGFWSCSTRPRPFPMRSGRSPTAR